MSEEPSNVEEFDTSPSYILWSKVDIEEDGLFATKGVLPKVLLSG